MGKSGTRVYGEVLRSGTPGGVEVQEYAVAAAGGAGFVDKEGVTAQNKYRFVFLGCARMAELADALASGASGLTVVEVRVLFRAPIPKCFADHLLSFP